MSPGELSSLVELVETSSLVERSPLVELVETSSLVERSPLVELVETSAGRAQWMPSARIRAYRVVRLIPRLLAA
ncbi:hypothetical protein C6V83_16355 [Gordonia iterans]|uniref:Uncharacterized protein n=1 Tax=Gordonia iterans TaxID=1004901 RepID=A0A2S0KIT3_9ACTN|nr:hypothetical protein C6V83_16355 [Gordonia iterans]